MRAFVPRLREEDCDFAELRERARQPRRERTEKKRTLNLRSPASGRNVSRVDISIPAPTRCFLPREQDSLSPPSSPRLLLFLPLPQDESQPPRNTSAATMLYENTRAHAQSHVRATEKHRENHSFTLFFSTSFSYSLSFFIFSPPPFLVYPYPFFFFFSTLR